MNTFCKLARIVSFLILLLTPDSLKSQPAADEINFVRQGVRRFIFDDTHTLPLSALNPKEIVGMSAMYPITHHEKTKAEVDIHQGRLQIRSDAETGTSIWFGGFNPFATYTLDLNACKGQGSIGFEFSD